MYVALLMIILAVLNSGGKTMADLFAVAEHFAPQGRVIDVRSFGHGNINDTFLVTMDTQGNAKVEKHFVLQRMNTRVFHRPDLVMRNMRTSTEHIHRRLQYVAHNTCRRWEVPVVLLAQDGQDHWLDTDGSFWRAISFIEDVKSFDTIKDVGQAGEVGHALGMFHLLLSDLPPDRLADTLEGFHITPCYLLRYDEVLAKYRAVGSPELNYCLRFVSARSAWAHVLENARTEGKLLLRPIHGDPKVNNILMDAATMQAVSIVDLDTVKPGLVHYDIGDCLRSGCNPMGEETGEWEAVYFETDLCRAVLQGYLSTAREFLTENDFDYLFDSVRLIAFELGLRFFTDHLEGDVYFKAKQPGHNLARALVQFRLTESIEAQETAIRNIIRETR
jgi:Ser/Thr protein kinase RdoA (MazF antagonist)